MSLPIFDPDFDDYPQLYRQIGLQVVPSYQPSEVRDWKRPKLSSWREHENELVSNDQLDRKSTRLNSSHTDISRMPSSA